MVEIDHYKKEAGKPRIAIRTLGFVISKIDLNHVDAIKEFPTPRLDLSD